MLTPKFPSHLLAASVIERIHYFSEEVMVLHPKMEKTLAELDEYVSPFHQRRLVLLIGASGVGKTALQKKLVDLCRSHRLEDMKSNRNLVPAVQIETEAPDEGSFQFASIYRDSLSAMEAPLIDQTLSGMERIAGETKVFSPRVEKSGGAKGNLALKDRFIRNLIQRETDVLCLDEAINIFKIGQPRSKEERVAKMKVQADKLKTFVNKTPTTIVLAGAYDFFDMTTTSGQVARRSQIIHAEPYADNQKDMQAFTDALLTLLSHLPTDIEKLLMEGEGLGEFALELFLQSLGCIGTLKGILTSALVRALRGNKPMTRGLVRQCFYPSAQLDRLEQELTEGMKAIKKFMSSEQLAYRAEARGSDTPPKSNRSDLKPGESRPSHRRQATSSWDQKDSVHGDE